MCKIVAAPDYFRCVIVLVIMLNHQFLHIYSHPAGGSTTYLYVINEIKKNMKKVGQDNSKLVISKLIFFSRKFCQNPKGLANLFIAVFR